MNADRRARLLVLIAAILASGMVFIDGTIVNVALPALQGAFDAGLGALQWVVEAYLLTLTGLLLAGGALGDRIGRRRVFTIGVVVFAGASLVCGAAQSVNQLVAARALQGIGGALLVPGSLALITASFDESRRGRAFGMWSAWTSITVAGAPLLGGWLIDAAGWRWIFLINLPLAAAALAVVGLGVPESRNGAGRGGIDWWGTALATLMLGGIVLALIEAPRLGFADPLVWGSALLGAAALVLLVRVERRSADPMLPPAMLRDPVTRGINLVTLALYAGLGGAMFFLPQHLIVDEGYTALEAGAAMLPFVLLLSVLSQPVGRLADRIGTRPPLLAGCVLSAAGLAALALPGPGAGYWSGWFPGITLLGLGMALAITPLTTIVMNAAPPGREGIASAINNAVARVAFLLAVAALGGVALAGFRSALPSDLLASLGDEALKLGAARAPGSEAQIQAAAAAGFRAAALVTAALALASAALAAALPRGKPRA